VRASVPERREAARAGIGVRAGNGLRCVERVKGDGGSVLSLLTLDGLPCARTYVDSATQRSSSCSSNERLDGEGLRTDESYDLSVEVAQRCGVAGGRELEDSDMYEGLSVEDIVECEAVRDTDMVRDSMLGIWTTAC